MKVAFVAVALVLSTIAASAQQPGPTPSQVALQIDNLINQWAQTIERQQQVVADLQKQVADLKAKYEPAGPVPTKEPPK